MSDLSNDAKIEKLDWVEPTVLVLDVEETFGRPNRGADASIHVDCTRS
jgi:hypothetical protein